MATGTLVERPEGIVYETERAKVKVFALNGFDRSIVKIVIEGSEKKAKRAKRIIFEHASVAIRKTKKSRSGGVDVELEISTGGVCGISIVENERESIEVFLFGNRKIEKVLVLEKR